MIEGRVGGRAGGVQRRATAAILPPPSGICRRAKRGEEEEAEGGSLASYVGGRGGAQSELARRRAPPQLALRQPRTPPPAPPSPPAPHQPTFPRRPWSPNTPPHFHGLASAALHSRLRLSSMLRRVRVTSGMGPFGLERGRVVRRAPACFSRVDAAPLIKSPPPLENAEQEQQESS